MISLQVNVMHPTLRVHDQWKRPTNSDEIWYSIILRKISPTEPLCYGRRTGIADTFKFEKQQNEL